MQFEYKRYLVRLSWGEWDIIWNGKLLAVAPNEEAAREYINHRIEKGYDK